MPGCNDYRYLWVRDFDEREQPDAVERSGHSYIADYQIGQIEVQHDQCFVCIVCLDYMIARFSKTFAEHDPDEEFILDNENAWVRLRKT